MVTEATPFKLLLVEDNPSDARLVRELLREPGSTPVAVTLAERMDAAVEHMRHEGFGAIILDLNLPDSRGLETLSRAHQEASDAPILVLTGFDDEELAAAAVRSGAQDYLVKGELDAEILRRAIRYAVERKHAEATIRWLTLAVEQSPAAVFMTDLDGTIRYVNRTFSLVSGFEPAEAIGRTPRILSSGNTPSETFRSMWETILGGCTWSGEVWNRRKNGERYLDAVRVSPIRDAHGTITHLLAIQEDITERHRQQDAVRRSEERFRKMVEHASDVIMLLRSDGRITYCTQSLRPTLGYEAGQLVGHEVLDLIHPDDCPAAARMLSEVMRDTIQTQRGEVRVRHREGRWRDLDVIVVNQLDDPAIGALIVTFRDVTDSRMAASALRESEARFRQMAEHIKEAFFIVESPSGKTLYVSPTYAEIWGREPSDEEPDLWLQSVHVDDFSLVLANRAKLLSGEPVTSQFRIVRPDLTERWVRSRVFPVQNEAGTVYRLVGVAEDITELRRAEEQFAQAQRLEAVGRLAGGVAHDFNNLLTVVQLEAELLQRESLLDDQTIKGLEEILKAANRAATLTRQLLTFSRRQPFEPTVFHINEVVTETTRMLERLVGENVRMVCDLASGNALIRADRGQMEQVLTNLVVNARDAMPRGGTLRIETRNVELAEDDAVRISDIAPGPYVQLSVSDTGIGMSAAVKARAIEPFFTTKEATKGTGLGLATSYGIVRASGGQLTLESDVEVGTTVRVFLPRLRHAPQDGDAGTAPALLKGTETILLVEDEDAVRHATVRILERLGYRVLQAQDAGVALDLIEQESEPIELLLTDVVLPGMQGHEMAQEVRRRRPQIRVLFASGYSEDVVLHGHGLEHGVSVIQKPFSVEALASAVRRALD